LTAVGVKKNPVYTIMTNRVSIGLCF